MLAKVEGFKNIVRKSTLNLSFDSTQILFNNEKITSKMVSRDYSAVVILDLPNDVFSNVMGEMEFNFVQPNQNLMPFLNLFDDEDEIEIIPNDNFITVKKDKHNVRIMLSVSKAVSTFNHSIVNMKPFVTLPIDDDFIDSYNKIKKIGPKFGKIYFNVEDGVLYIETTNREEVFSNSLKLKITDVNSPDTQLCFNYKNFVNAMTLINGNHNEFELKLFTVNVSDSMMGAVSIENGAKEQYYLASIKENV